MNKNEVKIERSMPVQSRIDLCDLATLALYWERNGVHIDSMSKLVSWSLSVLKDILKMNNKLEHEIDTLQDAYDVLVERGLIQQAMYKKMESKLYAARVLENIRSDGWEVDVNLRQFKELHKPGTVDAAPRYKPTDEEFQASMGMSKAEVEALVNKVERERREKSIEIQKANAQRDSHLVDIGDGVSIDLEDSQARAKAQDEAIKDQM